MSRLYFRPGNRVTIYWEPQDETLGKEAVSAVVGPVESYPADVTGAQAEQIREEYERLVDEQNSGGSS